MCASRIEKLRRIVDGVLRAQPDEDSRRAGWIHLYGVAQAAALLAMRRGIDVELAMAAGMLHDVATYQSGDSTDHAARGAVLARELLSVAGEFDHGEIDAICQAIARHSNKEAVDAPLDELLKDADVLQFCLYNPTQEPLPDRPWRGHRLARLLAGLDAS